MNKQFYVYILTNKNNSVLYVGVTSSILKRMYEHKHDINENSFSAKYCLKKLVYVEIHSEPESAIKREKQLKKWNRAWK